MIKIPPGMMPAKPAPAPRASTKPARIPAPRAPTKTVRAPAPAAEIPAAPRANRVPAAGQPMRSSGRGKIKVQ